MNLRVSEEQAILGGYVQQKKAVTRPYGVRAGEKQSVEKHFLARGVDIRLDF